MQLKMNLVKLLPSQYAVYCNITILTQHNSFHRQWILEFRLGSHGIGWRNERGLICYDEREDPMDSQAAFAAAKRAGKSGRARTVMKPIKAREAELEQGAVRCSWGG